VSASPAWPRTATGVAVEGGGSIHAMPCSQYRIRFRLRPASGSRRGP
jgi:hypothetical protein